MLFGYTENRFNCRIVTELAGNRAVNVGDFACRVQASGKASFAIKVIDWLCSLDMLIRCVSMPHLRCGV